MGENFRPIPVPENSVLSCGVQRDVVSLVGTIFSNQPRVSLLVSEGERTMTKENNSLGKFHLKGVPPMPRDAFEIEVDANGTLNVSARDEFVYTV